MKNAIQRVKRNADEETMLKENAIRDLQASLERVICGKNEPGGKGSRRRDQKAQAKSVKKRKGGR